MTQQPDREVAILNASLELNAAERPAYLDHACAGDASLRRRVEELLRAHEQAEGFMESPPAGLDFQRLELLNPPLLEKPGDKIGRYKLLQQIGEGGCGVVYMAEQEEPVKRRVALKVIKLGMDTKQVIARFEAERQALALMDHPNIAKVLEAGATNTGRPYFVMELVRGIKITDFCDENKVPTEDRLKLFIQVCQAIQHAHQKGVIHRDIKPSNILVTINDGVPVPKVIDFGIAKATQGRLTDQTLFTAFEQFIGTPAYMSPEQAVMTSLDIDTRSDIYSLGVLLYELLTGNTPFDQKELLAAGLEAMRRTIREVEPVKPSTRLTQDLVAAPRQRAANASHENGGVLRRRHSDETRNLIHIVRGDLDWIVMKSLDKDRTRRYDTANGLAMDIERHLHDEPVLARPPSALYRLQKSVRRNKGAVAAASAIAAVLFIGAAGSTWQAIRATRSEREQSRLRQQAVQAGDTAKRQERLARESADDARLQQSLASEQALLAHRRFYAAQMNLANQAVEAGQPGRALELLETQRPRAAAEDLRTFEWYYLWGRCNERLRMTLRAYQEPVNSVAISPDGKTLASASSDSTIRLWDTTTGREGLTLKLQPGNSVFAVAFTPDGKTLAAGYYDGLVRLWDVASGKLRATLPCAHGWVRGLAISPDGSCLACGGDEGLIKLFDLATGAEQTTLSHEGHVFGIAFSRDGRILAGAYGWTAVRLWDLKHGALEPKLQDSNPARAVAFSPDGKLLAAAAAVDIQVWDTTTGLLRATLRGHTPPIESVVWLSDGKALASCASDRTVRLWSMPPTNSVVTENQIIGEHLDMAMCLAISADGTTLASGANDGSVKLWNLGQTQDQAEAQVASHFQIGTGSTNGGLSSLLFSPDGNSLIGVMEHATAARNIASGLDYLVLAGANRRGALSPDGKLLATGDKAGTVKLWDFPSGRLLATTQAHTSEVCLAFSPDGRMLVTCGLLEQELKAWDPIKALHPLWGTATKPATLGISALAFSPDGKMIAAMVRQAGVAFFDAATGRQNESFPVERGFTEVWALAFSPDGRFVATGSESGTARLWNVETGELHAALQGHTAMIFAVAFSPDGGTVATGSDDQTVRLWDAATGQERITLKGFQSWLRAVTFSPDGNTLAAGSIDARVCLWRANRTAEATALGERVLEAGPNAAENYNNLAWTYAVDPDPARRDGQKALRLAEKAVAATDRKNAMYLDTLAAAHAESGQFTNAVSVQQEALALVQDEQEKVDYTSRLKLYENKSPYRDSGLLAEQAYARLCEGKFAEAEGLARQCLAVREREIPDHWRTFNARSMLGGALLGQKKFADAEPLLLSGYQGMKQREASIPRESKPHLTEALQRLVQLYEATGQSEKVAEWNKMLAKGQSLLEGQTNTPPEKKPEPR